MSEAAWVQSPIQAQWVEDPILPQLWCGLQQWLGFDPWPGNFHRPQVWPGEEKGEKRRKETNFVILIANFE